MSGGMVQRQAIAHDHGLRIRLACRDDLAALDVLIARSVRGLSVGFYTVAEFEAALRYVFGVDSKLIDDGTYFVAERAGVLLGCGGWSRFRTLYGGDQRPSGPADLLDAATEPARLRAFFVAPEAARQGVGVALFQACRAAALECGFGAFALVATLPGVPFYRSLGFEAQAPLTDHLPNGVAIQFVPMELNLV